jgi:hypothetical protein
MSTVLIYRDIERSSDSPLGMFDGLGKLNEVLAGQEGSR